MMGIINVQGLCFQYEKKQILKNVSFQIDPGEFVCVAGANGSGKSTLLKILVKLLAPTAGTAEISTAKVAYLSQKATAFNPDFPATAAEVVGLGFPRRKGISFKDSFKGSFKERRRRIDSALSEMDMLQYRSTMIGRLSGGQQQRVLLAKALVQEPELIILDEPTIGIDNGSIDQICCLLAELNKRCRTTILMVTHDIPLVLHHANRILQMEKDGSANLCSQKDFKQKDFEISGGFNTLGTAL